MRRLLAPCLAVLIWVLTPPAIWLADWLEKRRQNPGGR